MLLQNLTSAGYFNRLQVFWLGRVHLSGFVLVNNSDLLRNLILKPLNWAM